MSFTPGPWRVAPYRTINSGNQPILCDDAETPVVASASKRKGCASNARLIAAAPDLLAAAELALIELNFCVEVAGRRGGLYEKARDALQAAIAQARDGK